MRWVRCGWGARQARCGAQGGEAASVPNAGREAVFAPHQAVLAIKFCCAAAVPPTWCAPLLPATASCRLPLPCCRARVRWGGDDHGVAPARQPQRRQVLHWRGEQRHSSGQMQVHALPSLQEARRGSSALHSSPPASWAALLCTCAPGWLVPKAVVQLLACLVP